jgi:hypothetical protein
LIKISVDAGTRGRAQRCSGVGRCASISREAGGVIPFGIHGGATYGCGRGKFDASEPNRRLARNFARRRTTTAVTKPMPTPKRKASASLKRSRMKDRESHRVGSKKKYMYRVPDMKTTTQFDNVNLCRTLQIWGGFTPTSFN